MVRCAFASVGAVCTNNCDPFDDGGKGGGAVRIDSYANLSAFNFAFVPFMFG